MGGLFNLPGMPAGRREPNELRQQQSGEDCPCHDALTVI